MSLEGYKGLDRYIMKLYRSNTLAQRAGRKLDLIIQIPAYCKRAR
jgi:hypothetical protein